MLGLRSLVKGGVGHDRRRLQAPRREEVGHIVMVIVIQLCRAEGNLIYDNLIVPPVVLNGLEKHVVCSHFGSMNEGVPS